MKSFISTPIRYSLVLLTIALFVSGCSSSSDSTLGESEADTNPSITNGDGLVSDEGTDSVATEMENTTTGDTSSGTAAESTDGIDESTTGGGLESESDAEGLSITRVDFDITVPVYSSDALQVRLIWGDINTTAMWNIDQHWTASADFPVSTTDQLVVTFSDDNGAITLGSFESSFTTSANPSESLQITADDFDTDRWDSDGDGVINIEELSEGFDPTSTDTNSGSEETLSPVSASVELIPDKTFRIRWQSISAADFYRVLENPDGVSGFTAVSGELDASTEFYDHRVGLHQRVNARYMVEACNSAGCTLSAQQLIEGNLVEAIGYLKASTLGRADFFGSDVRISGDGNTLAVSAPFEDSAATGVNGDQGDNSAENSGAVYIFTRSGSGWQQQAYLKASNTDARDAFGSELSISADGNTLAVGVPDEDSNARGVNGDQSNNSARSAGAVYVFVRNEDSWQQQVYLKAANTQVQNDDSADEFAGSISLSADGNTLAAGAYVFVRSDDSWQQQAHVKSSTSEGSSLGRSVSLSADGNIMAVTSLYRTGAVHMFERSGGNWQEATVIGDLGGSPIVSLSGDGNTLAVAARYTAIIFEHTGGHWQEQARFNKYGQTTGGNSTTDGISLSTDGNTLAFGRSAEGTGQRGLQGYQGIQPTVEKAGAAYVYTRGDGTWLQEVYVKASNTSTYDTFGLSVSLSANGDTLVVGAHVESGESTGFDGDQTEPDGGEFGASGAVYLY